MPKDTKEPEVRCTCDSPKLTWLCISYYDTGMYCLICDKKEAHTGGNHA